MTYLLVRENRRLVTLISSKFSLIKIPEFHDSFIKSSHTAHFHVNYPPVMLGAASLACYICIVLVGTIAAGPISHEQLDAKEICKAEDGLGLLRGPGTLRDISDDEEAGKVWLERYNKLSEGALCRSVVADWNYNTNLTDRNQDASVSSYHKESCNNSCILLL